MQFRFLHLAYNGSILGNAKRDSAAVTTYDTLGSSSDTWSAALTPDTVNSNSFGLFINSDGNGVCTFSQFSITITIYYQTGAGIASITKESHITISPNPAANYLNITLPPYSSLTVTNVVGQIITSSSVTTYSTPNTKLNVTNYPNGIYFLRAQSDSGVEVVKFVVQH